MILNVILVLLIISTIVNLITKSPINSTLNCGLWGYYGASKRQFNWTKFDWIGSELDHRGGDACGRVCGDVIEHSVDNKTKTYKGYIDVTLPPKIGPNTKAIFGHTRKSSSYINKAEIEYAQPLIFFDENQGKINFIGSHNGTIYNHKELADKYGISDIKHDYVDDNGVLTSVEMNDSQVLLYILGKLKKYDVLKEYNGSAAFAWYDYNDNLLYLWSGESKIQEYGKYTSIERPLYVLTSKNHLWFSSETKALRNINYSEVDEIDEIPTNTLCIYKDGILIEEKKYDRIEMCQSYIYKKHNNYETKFVDKREFKPQSTVDVTICRECGGSGYSFKDKHSQIKCPKCMGFGFTNKKAVQLPLPLGKSNSLNSEIFNDNEMRYSDFYVVYFRGRYYYRNAVINGILHLNGYGFVFDNKSTNKTCKDPKSMIVSYYFIDGNMMLGHEEYNEWTRTLKKKTMTMGLYELMATQCRIPLHHKEKDLMLDNLKEGLRFTGSINPLFSKWIYTFTHGAFTGKECNSSGIPSSVEHVDEFNELKKINNKDTVDELPFKNELESDRAYERAYSKYEDEAEDEESDRMVKRELSGELSELLRKINSVSLSIFIHRGNSFAEKVDTLMNEMELALIDLGISE